MALRPYDDVPFISYYDQTNGYLMLAYPVNGGGGNCGINESWFCAYYDGWTTDVGKYSSIDAWGDSSQKWRLGISYYDATNRALKYTDLLCQNNSCHWNTITVVSPDFNWVSIGLYTSIKFNSSGVPGIVYYFSSSQGVDSLRYAHPVNSGGNCGEGSAAGLWQCDIVDSGDGVGQYATTDMSWDNQLYIAYYDGGQGDLKLAYYVGFGNCGLNNDWYCTTLDGTDGSNVGLYASLKAPQFSGDPLRVAYYDITNGNLKYYDSTGWKLVIDSMGTSLSSMGISMDIDKDGFPAIAYQQIASELSRPVLRIVRPYLVFDDGSYGNCGDVPPGYLFQYWRCSTLDNASQYTSGADFVSLVINSKGFAKIAYSEYDEYNDITSLKYIYQYSQTFLPLLNKP
jgi:hypothetical protein